MNPTICWPDKTLPVEIHCAPGVLTSIEIAAADGLLAMPRFGLGVGGLLMGKRENGRIEITRSVEIACSHTLGPGFVLTPEEIEAERTRKLTESADVANEASDSDVVGWYCSKPSGTKTAGPLALSDHDRVLFDALCPQLWQIALLVRPNVGKTTTAAFGMREPDGFVVSEPQELAWQELLPADEEAVESELDSVATAVGPRPVEPEVAAVVQPEPEPVPDAVEMPVPVPRSGTLFGVPDSAPEESKPKKRKWPVLIIAVIPLIFVAAAYFTQQYWMPFAEQHWTPRPPVALIASSNWRGRVAIVWNTQAVLDQGKGTLVIDDGAGPAHTIHLERAGLDLGLYEYDCRPGTTTVTLVTDDLSGRVTVKVAAEPYLPESGISK